MLPFSKFKTGYQYFKDNRRKGSVAASGIFVLPKYCSHKKYTRDMSLIDFAVPNLMIDDCSVPMQAWFHKPVAGSNIQVSVCLTDTSEVNKMKFDAYADMKSNQPALKLRTLMDTGASHSVITIKTAKRLGLHIIPCDFMSATMANNTKARIYGKVKFTIRIQGVVDIVTALVMDDIPSQYDLILGMEWFTKNDVELHPGKGCAIIRTKKNHFKIFAEGFSGLHAEIESALHAKPVSYKTAAKYIKKGAQSFMLDVTSDQREYPDTVGPSINAYALNNADMTHVPAELSNLIKEFADVFAPMPVGVPPDRGISHVIPLAPGSTPAYRGMYRLSPAELDECCKQVRELLEKKLIEPSTSPFSAPILFVSKPDGGLRMCLDYRMLNTMTIKNKAPLPRVDDLFDKLGGCSFFSSLDLQSGYYQIRIPESDVHKTAFNSPLGHFQWRVLTFGLTNAPATFQAEMNHIFAKQLNKFVLVYLDDILIYSKTLKEHIAHMREVLLVLRNNKLYAKLSKCEFCLPEVTFLGHMVGKDGIKVDPKKIKSVRDYPVPKTVTEVRAFLGLCNYFRKYVKGYSHIAHPLTDLTNKDATLKSWNDTHNKSFEHLKKALCEAPVLKIADFNKPFTIVSDASIIGTGAVLLQEGQPIAYCSKKLSKAERNYFTTEQELLGVIHALEEFRCYVEGGKFPVTIVTDHNPNTFLRTQVTLSRRQARWVEYMERFDYVWKYIPGRDNMADPLSRTPTFALINASGRSPGVELTDGEGNSTIELPDSWLKESKLSVAIKLAYTKDKSFLHRKEDKLYKLNSDGLWTRGAFDSISKIDVPNDPALHHAILRELHDSKMAGHPGVKRTYNLVSRYFYWRGMFKFVEHYVQHCHSCQMMKSTNIKPAGLLQPLQLPDYPFQSVSMDLITCLPTTANKNNTIIVMVDRLTKYVILVPTVEKLSAEGFAQLWVDHLVSKHGCPESIVSDRDVRFTSAFWTTLNTLVGADAHMSTAFHPQTDGQTERMNRLLEETLRHFVCYNQSDWDVHLQMASFAINNAVSESTKDSPFHLMKGLNPRLPCSFSSMFKNRSTAGKNPSAIKFSDRIQASLAVAKQALLKAQQNQKSFADKKRMELKLKSGDWVMLNTKNLKLKKDDRTIARKKLLPKFIGPYRVVEPVGFPGREVSYRLSLPAQCKIHDVFHVSLLKPYKEPSDEQHLGFLPQPLDWLDGMPMFEVDRIAGHKIVNLRGGQKSLEYLIKWQNFDSSYDTWEPAANIIEDIPSELQIYISKCAHTANPVPDMDILNKTAAASRSRRR